MDNGDRQSAKSDAWWSVLTGKVEAGTGDDQQRDLRRLVMQRQAEAEALLTSEKMAAGRSRLLHSSRQASESFNAVRPWRRSQRLLALAASVLVGVTFLFASVFHLQPGDGRQVLRSGGTMERVRGVTSVYRVTNDAPHQLGQSLSDAMTAASIAYELAVREDGVLALTLSVVTLDGAGAVNNALGPTKIEIPGPGYYQIEIRKRE